MAGKPLRDLEINLKDPLVRCTFSPDGRHLASVLADKAVGILGTEKRKSVRRPEGHTDAEWSVAFSPDGNQLASESSDMSISDSPVATSQIRRIWDVATGGSL